MNVSQKRAQDWVKMEPQLQVADIILTREKSILSAAVRKVTGSYWSHASIVFAVPDKNVFFNNTLVISAEEKGIEIHRIQKYTQHFDFCDLGVKRVPGLSDEIREVVLSYVLNNVDIPYDFSRLFGFVFKYLENKFVKKEINHMNKSFFNENAFICSSFIQKAFYAAAPVEKKESVIFKEDRSDSFFLEEVTPADIANSKNCDWVYNENC